MRFARPPLACLTAALLLLATPALHATPVRPHARAGLTLALAPSRVVSGASVSGTITLPAPAPASGTAVVVVAPAGVTIQGGSLVLGAPPGARRFTVPAGQLTTTFRGFVAGVAAQVVAILTATSGPDVATATLTIDPASVISLSFAPARVVGGTPATGTVTLNGAAPAGTGATIALGQVREAASRGGTNNNLKQLPLATQPTATVSLPASIPVPPGASSASFALTADPVAVPSAATVLATLGASSATGTLTVQPPVPGALQLSPATVVVGNPVTGTVILTGPAPAPGFAVQVTASSPLVTLPKVVTVPAGADRQSFPIGTQSGSTTTTISGSGSLTLSAASGTGLTSTTTVTLVATVPSTGGSVRSISDGTSNTILLGAPSPSATLTLQPPPPPQPAAPLSSFTVRPTTVTGGQSTILQLVLASGVTITQTVTLTSDHPQLVQLPASIQVTPPHSAALTVATSPVSAPTTVTISASAGSQQIPVTITIVP